MRLVSFCVLVSTTFVLLGPSTSAEAAWVCGLKKGKELYLRSCPKTSCRVRDSHPNSTKVDALKSNGTFWIYVRVQKTKKKGWMSEHYLCGDDIDFG